jgi:predicted RNase H-like nuclease (RuvC/YqgF family)
MSPLFGGNDDAKKIGEDMQKLSEQIGALQQQLAKKTSEADTLRTQAAQGASASAALKDAQAQMQALRDQLAAMQKQQSQGAAANAELQQAHAQVEALQQQLNALQQAGKAQESQGRPTGVSSVSATSAGGLAAGTNAWVTRAGGLPLRLRSGPSLEGSVVDRLQPGTQMTLIAGPQHADGHAWWHIRTTDGREGWVAGEDLRSQPD